MHSNEYEHGKCVFHWLATVVGAIDVARLMFGNPQFFQVGVRSSRALLAEKLVSLYRILDVAQAKANR